MSDFTDHRVQSDSPLSRKLLFTACALLSIAATFFGGAATAQEKFPSRPIEIVVPAPAGGSLDTAFRILEPSLSARLGVPLVILNRPGASGTIGMASVTRARADGYTRGNIKFHSDCRESHGKKYYVQSSRFHLRRKLRD